VAVTVVPPGPLVVVSPHFDDGVFSCGELLAEHPGSTVITVFGGGPAEYARATGWDRSAGFEDGDDVMRARRAEDGRALQILGARQVWLPFQDAQYGEEPGVEDVVFALDAAIRRCEAAAVLIPCGLFHSDHRLTHAAAMMLLRRGERGGQWLAYEDAIYRRLDGLLEERLLLMRSQGFETTRVAGPASASQRKREAVAAYASQLRALSQPGHPGFDDAFEPEVCWALTYAGAGLAAATTTRERTG
jgi:LmbE family N-acetylglucosaminyl deacetylase